MIGIDIVEIKRFEKVYKKFGGKFLERIFNEGEINLIKKGGFNLSRAAGFYAAKEAVSKALKAGIGGRLSFLDMTISISVSGAPCMEVIGGYFKGRNLEISIAHERHYAVAVAMSSMP